MLRGKIGAADRLDIIAIGPAVNLVNRLEGLCCPLGQPVPISLRAYPAWQPPAAAARQRVKL
jgi:class 3 adenylate cyclase